MATLAALGTRAVPSNPSSSLLACSSWRDVQLALDSATVHAKGAVFELLVQAFLTVDSRYDFENVWSTHGDVPKSVLKKLNLFDRDVTGIDLVAKARGGKYWAVQCKYHHDEHSTVSRAEATGLIAGRNRARHEFELALLCTTANSRSANLAGEPDLEFLMGDVWRGLGPEFFTDLHAHLAGLAPAPPSLKAPREHQVRALRDITAYFEGNARGKVIMPCATGKSLVGFWSAHELGARRVLVAVPNLSLVRQLLKDWTEQSLAHGRRPRWIVVCSDDSVADSVAAKDLGVKVDTDPREVGRWLRANRSADVSVVFSTYQSGRVLAEAAERAGFKFDFGIFDEAHRTAGREGAPFAYLLSDQNVHVEKRLYMTATPRIYKGKDRADIISMDDPAVYGGEAFRMTFLDAMDRGVIPNLVIVAVTVSEGEVEKLLRHRLFVRLQSEHQDEVIRAEDLVSALALRKAMRKYGIRRSLGFYLSRKRCMLAAKVQELIGTLLPEYGGLDLFHVDGEMTAAERDAELRTFEASERALLTNVRVFVEGVDCPSMDAVIFADPRQSIIDIVQGVGRALRPFPGKQAGYAIIPVIIEDDGTPSDDAYDQLVRVACALGSENEVLFDYFAAVAQGKPWTGRRVFELLADVDTGIPFSLENVNRAVAVRTYERTAPWRPFLASRAFVRALRLNSVEQWRAYCRSDAKPPDIPAAPNTLYSDAGWISFSDWLGTERIANQDRTFRPFVEARAFARTLRLKSGSEWRAYANSGQLPEDIPAAPGHAYRHDGWRGVYDWLGSERRRGQGWRPFESARQFVRALGLTGRPGWRTYTVSGRKPTDIPSKPEHTYRSDGWQSYADWLGSGTEKVLKPRPFSEARAFARSLRLRSRAEWQEYVQSGALPKDIPPYPETSAYSSSGWSGYGDWLGTGRIADHLRHFRSFDDARRFVRALGLKSGSEWRTYSRSANKPNDIPRAPARVYANEGWQGMGDWLGTGNIATQNRQYCQFQDARVFVHTLALKSRPEWVEYCQSGQKPDDIPANPNNTYRSDWRGMQDWLGAGPVTRKRQYRAFAEARGFARSLGLASSGAWFAYCRGLLADKPAKPRYPNRPSCDLPC